MRKGLPYKRLAGNSQPYFGLVRALDLLLFLGQNSSAERMRLYAGEDHLLLIRQKFFTERVHRFYYPDIQAITIRKDGRALGMTLLLLVLGVALAALYFLSGGLPGPYGEPFLAVLSLVLLVAFLLNLVLGPTCVTEIHTAVARIRLTNLERWRAAKSVLGQVEPQIRAAQGTEGLLVETEEGVAFTDIPLITGEQSEPPLLLRHHDALRPGQPRETVIFSLLLILCGISSIFDIFYYNTAKNIGDCVLYTVVLVVGSVGYGRIRRTTLPGGLKLVHVLGLTAIIVLFYLSQVVMTGRMMFSYALTEEVDQEALVMPIIRVFSSVATVIFLSLATWGLAGVWRFRNSLRQDRSVADAQPPGDEDENEQP